MESSLPHSIEGLRSNPAKFDNNRSSNAKTMTIPDFQSIMLPLLKDLEAGERTGRETHEALATFFGLSSEELAQRIPSGTAFLFANRIGWAKTHLKGAGLIEAPARSVYRLTARGRTLLAASPPIVNLSVLRAFPEYNEFRSGGNSNASNAAANPDASEVLEQRTPDDLIDEGYRLARAALAAELRERIHSMSPAGFEQLVIDLLTAMGYGGAYEDAAKVVGRSGDEGIDGVIKEDRLGLDTIYVQAKRWQAVVGRPEIQRFAGALQGQRARKGVFITSSTFSGEALKYAASIQTTIVLLDGAMLAELMIDHGVGVATMKRIEIKRVDSDYFAEE